MIIFTLAHDKRKYFCKLNYHDQKIQETLVCDIQKHWTAVSTLLGLIKLSSVSVCAEISGHGNSIHKIILLLKKKKKRK